MIVEWRPEARADLWEILEYIDERNSQAADALNEEIERATSALLCLNTLIFTGWVGSPRHVK